jgi:hypothetical protein
VVQTDEGKLIDIKKGRGDFKLLRLFFVIDGCCTDYGSLEVNYHLIGSESYLERLSSRIVDPILF